jgi:hypothetical protein
MHNFRAARQTLYDIDSLNRSDFGMKNGEIHRRPV